MMWHVEIERVKYEFYTASLQNLILYIIYFQLKLYSILYLNFQLKSYYILFSLKDRIDKFINNTIILNIY